ncbi:hypothetical protein CHU98_g11793 [Xylaria longipes]|nr:hypothetical protein CHU98_g11793 [Xylaria longipes]
MASDVESVEAVESAIVADIRTLVTRRLREEHLQDFVRTRNELLQLERSDAPETMRLLRRQNLRVLEKTWDRVLQALRNELPNMLDQIFSNLQPEFQETAGLSASLLGSTSTTQPVSVETPSATNYTFEPMPAPASGVSVTTSPTANRACSVTFAPNTTVFEEAEEPSTSIEAETPVLDSTNEPSNKRALDPEEPAITSISKKAKKTPQTHDGSPSFRIPIRKSIDLSEVKAGECVFSYDNYFGVYVLRCNLVKCKKRLKQDGPIIFNSHPFREGLAFDHFDGEGHNLDSEEEIFRKFASRGNTEKKHDSVFDSSCSEVDLALPPVSPKKSRDKGKRPERPFMMYSPRKAEASTSESASKTSETFRQSFYRAGTLPSISDPTLPNEDNIGLD